MSRYFAVVVVACMLLSVPTLLFSSESSDAVVVNGQKQVFGEVKANIPKDNFKTVDDLYKKWEEVQEGKSKAILIDARTEAEFDSGHILNSNNIDLGLFYTLPEKIQSVDSEIWVFCRTQHRATYFAGLLHKCGYNNVHVVDKGIVGWAEKGYPLVNKYLGEFKVVKYTHKLKETYSFRDNK